MTFALRKSATGRNSMTTDVTESARDVAADWLQGWAAAVERQDAPAAAAMFTEDGYWRDLLAFTWDLRTFHGKVRMAAALREFSGAGGAGGFRLEEGQEAVFTERNGVACLEAFFIFETSAARARGHLRLVRDEANPTNWQAWTLLTASQELKGFEERTGHRRPRGNEHSRGRENWLDRRSRASRFEDSNPDVVVIGAGQAGLSLAARLGVLGVSTLVIDREERVGDNWRNRYHSLALHNEIWGCHLPYMQFPPNWPAYIPKDMLAIWFEFYALSMELNVWTSTELVEGTFDEQEQRWTTRLRRADGTVRTLRPRHVVLAIGVSGIPNVPQIPGAEHFQGPIVHSSSCKVDSTFEGKRVLVVGSANSAHDIAQELHGHGADVTMLQRVSTCVVSVEPSAATVFHPYREGGPPAEDVDLVGSSVPFPLLTEFHKSLTEQFAEWDTELLSSLERVGFKTDLGDDGSGFYLKYLRTGGGYYLNVGCSDLIIAGEIRIKQGVDVARLTSDTAIFGDGSSIPVDMVVLATGYQNMQESVRSLLGDTIADRVGKAWGFDDEGELRNMWRRTAQEGFWLMGGSLAQCRNYSRYLALQIKAIEEGLLPAPAPERGAVAVG
jgi:cation diffusion facilitator CzcD-associated flavoprotein CzcO